MGVFQISGKGSTNLRDGGLDFGGRGVGGDSATGERSKGLTPQRRSLASRSTEEHVVRIDDS